MPNDYYNRLVDFVPGASVRSDDVDQELDGVVAGFDKLGDPTKIGNGGTLWGYESGTADNYVYDNGGAVATTVAGQIITFAPLNTSTGASVISYNGGSNYPIARNDGTQVQAGDLIEGVPTMMIWDATVERWVLIGSTASQAAETLRPGVVTEATTARTLTAADENKVILCTNAAATAITLPSDATEDLSVGFLCHLHQDGDGQITVTPDTGVTIRASVSTASRTQYSSLSVIKIAANTWKVIGDMSLE